MSSFEKRQAATEAFLAAANAINTAFERADTVRTTLDTITAAAAGPDPVRAAGEVLAHAALLREALTELHRAAALAAEHRGRRELAKDLDTHVGLLFPRRTAAGDLDATGVASVSARDVAGPPSCEHDRMAGPLHALA